MPWACSGSTEALQGWMNHRKEGKEKERKDKGGVGTTVKSGLLRWGSCSAGWRHLLLCFCWGSQPSVSWTLMSAFRSICRFQADFKEDLKRFSSSTHPLQNLGSEWLKGENNPERRTASDRKSKKRNRIKSGKCALLKTLLFTPMFKFYIYKVL